MPFKNKTRKKYKIKLRFYDCRGQESAGIVTSVGNDAMHFNVKKGMGLVSGIFNDEAMKQLKGDV